MEAQLAEKTSRDFDEMLRREIEGVQNIFRTQSNKFDEYFRELLRKSRRDFHKLFKDTYGVMYEQNSHVFVELFRDLEDYYEKGRIDLNDALKKFFSVLYQKMFTVLNAQFHFDEAYLRCVTRHMEDLKPFGDVPQKLSFQVKRSFVASRTYVQGLRVARDILSEILKVRMSSSCKDAVMRMTSCPACNGLRSGSTRPCMDYCLNVLKGCLAFHAELHTDWDEFIGEYALLKVGARLDGSFNIEEVVDPIAIQISDAIMNFQENGNSVSQKVFKGCGQPRLEKRSVPPGEPLMLSGGSRSRVRDDALSHDHGGEPPIVGGVSIRKFVKEVREKVEMLKGFWLERPMTICSGGGGGGVVGSGGGGGGAGPGGKQSFIVAAVPSTSSSSNAKGGDTQQCWTGTDNKAIYAAPVVGDGLKNQASNPEVSVDQFAADTTINDQILDLKLIISKLMKAHDGVNVDWIDYEDWKSPSRWNEQSGGKNAEDKSGRGRNRQQSRTKSGSSGDGNDANDGSKKKERYPYAYPWASGMAKEEDGEEGSGAVPPSSSTTTTHRRPGKEDVELEGSGADRGVPETRLSSATDLLSHADDEDFPYVPAGTISGRRNFEDEGSGFSGVVLPPSPGSRPPAPPISGEAVDDLLPRRYKNNQNGVLMKDVGGAPKPSTTTTTFRSVTPTTFVDRSPVMTTTPPPPRSKITKSSSPSATKRSSQQSLLWTVFTPMFVTWVGGIFV
ncbi:unnamed protein product [Notodromas monacha]|uniref:Glypican-6 n=1 Tax=Notodromas monacha TaxID=399045 RepID=A0A7R9BEQ6_9CRUS|nr:unnamed protein product [Notodromas monacha]CAG0913936.1 unnamed protein product [Notodromas monacha]